MKKTSVYLTEIEAETLRRLSEREGKPQAFVLREAIMAYDEASATTSAREFAIFDTFRGDGRSVADIPEDELLEGFGEDSDSHPSAYKPRRQQ